MHSYEDRIRAVELYYRYGKKASVVVMELGNGWPVNTPVNASPHTSRYATHDSGTLWIAGPSMVGDFHPLISNRSPGAH